MNKTSKGGFQARLHRQTAENKAAIEESERETKQHLREAFRPLIEHELPQLGKRLRQAANAERRTFETDMETARQRRRAALQQENEELERHLQRRLALLGKAWLWALAIGTALSLGISLGTWGLTRYLAARIQNQLETQAGMERRIQERSRTLDALDARTWGVQLQELEGERYLVLPPGTQVLDGRNRPQTPAWTVDGAPAVKLSTK